MARKVTIEISAPTEAEITTKEKAVKVLAEKLSAKELDRLRMILLYDPDMLSKARQFLGM
jgi:hypothetical protein